MNTFAANMDRVIDMFKRRITEAADDIDNEIIQAKKTTVAMSKISEKSKIIPARVTFTLDIYTGDDSSLIFGHVLKVGHQNTKNHGKCEEHSDDNVDMFEKKE